MLSRITLSAVFLLSAAANASAVTPLGCLIEPDRTAEVGSPVVGVIDQMLVERGDVVHEGQPIAVLKADVQRAALQVARSKALSEADIQAARASSEFAQQRLERAEDLFNKKFIPQQTLDQARTEADVARQKLAQVQEQQRIWAKELQLAEAQLSERTLHSPINGVVAERYVSAGERIEQQAVVRIVKVDPLRVELIVPAAAYGKIKTDGTMAVSPELANVGPMNAKVVLVDKIIDAASNTFRVRLQLPNPDSTLPAGLRCQVDLGPLSEPLQARSGH
jgi:RND family efflux transporter MFP subunit